MPSFIKYRMRGERKFRFLTRDGGGTWLRIHASPVEGEKVEGLVDELARDNPTFEFKSTPCHVQRKATTTPSEDRPMSIDPTESARREMLVEINHAPGSREALQAKYGQVFDTASLQEHFDVLGFMAPVVVVRHKASGTKGSLTFQHSPRFYYGFQPA